MTDEKIFETTTKVSPVAKNRPKSLRIAIPTTIRELMDITPQDEIIWEIYQENGKKYAKLYKKTRK
ncbi:hypothetical protein [Methanosphaera sp.]|uniref:hypothetical protein n=1 Tax=Methanosphaera sp. TaxID=2666342 RepID=UPI0025DDA399|nr:hypothetical protein [Methanosphaera sp.]